MNPESQRCQAQINAPSLVCVSGPCLETWVLVVLGLLGTVKAV